MDTALMVASVSSLGYFDIEIKKPPLFFIMRNNLSKIILIESQITCFINVCVLIT